MAPLRNQVGWFLQDGHDFPDLNGSHGHELNQFTLTWYGHSLMVECLGSMQWGPGFTLSPMTTNQTKYTLQYILRTTVPIVGLGELRAKWPGIGPLCGLHSLIEVIKGRERGIGLWEGKARAKKVSNSSYISICFSCSSVWGGRGWGQMQISWRLFCFLPNWVWCMCLPWSGTQWLSREGVIHSAAKTGRSKGPQRSWFVRSSWISRQTLQFDLLSFHTWECLLLLKVVWEALVEGKKKSGRKMWLKVEGLETAMSK